MISVFISAVTKDFGSLRERLARDLGVNAVVAVVHQVALGPSGTDTLPKLDDHIARCDAVVHIVGDRIGGFPKRNEVPELLERHGDLKSRLGIDDAVLRNLT